MIIDLSHPIFRGMPVYPGDPEVATAPATSIAVDGFAVTALQLGTHSGTHVDAPSHSIEGGAVIDEIDPARLVGRARILRVAASDGETIGAAALEQQLAAWDNERIALVHTGWDAHWGTARMLQHPSVSLELADALLALGVDVLGVDTLSPDLSDMAAGEARDEPPTLAVHERWLGAGGLIIENLRGLGDVPGETCELIALPLRLQALDGSPVRAVARV
ncbi:cyclase family protein [Agrococcus sp. 1P02AA]|uniref:cyclase family protein n=1 Tax=Agrococcus sp. 1P02AA TaxID=3132259 RepID=UPI0039A54EDF